MGNLNFQDMEKYRTLPEIALQIISFLDLFISKDMRVFEWGAGGSTVFFAERSAEVISVEHDRKWHELVDKALTYRGFNGGCDLRHVSYDKVLTINSDQFQSSQPMYKGKTFEQYVTAIDEFADEYFDIVFVDGRARSACVTRATPKIKPGGLLVVDNTERAEYQRALKLAGWHRSDAIGPAPYLPLQQLVQTTVLVKP